MNENLNLVEILKDCPKGTKLYSTVYGEVRLTDIKSNHEYPVKYITSNSLLYSATAQGLIFSNFDGECTLFPSREQRDWSKFKVKKPKFDPNTLKSFDKVLVRNTQSNSWAIEYFSHIDKRCKYYPFFCLRYNYTYCIPHNDDTKHLVGTTDEAPEYYRYWED